ncbi:hypothetical protein RI543_002667 [Arxiozyma heterogenica]|uniref:Uncharacterized protein n=1 Tax=Arxiozyma heterogenica TaxID=278026 RepID=A0AAN7WHR2_9SACH|nr:hypothetical protein RI543_002667 [Kazachstania heterogenica]
MVQPEQFKTVGYVFLGGALSIYIVKSIIKSKRDAKFKPQAMIDDYEVALNQSKDKMIDDYYANIAQVKPGFPLPKSASNKGNSNGGPNVENAHAFQRKSKYEAGGVSAVTRKRGDKLGFWNRRSNND